MASLKEGVYLLFHPLDSFELLGSPLEVFMVNHTSCDLMFAFHYKTPDGFVTLESGAIGSGGRVFIDILNNENFETFSHIKIDLIFYKNAFFEPRDPVSCVIKLRQIKYYKESNYQVTPFHEEPVYLHPLQQLQEERKVEPKIEDLKHLFDSKEKPQEKKVSKPHLRPSVMEVDLHLEEIVDDSTGMNNSQKLDAQIRHFKRKMEEAVINDVHKVIFIHGVGNGTLKQAIRAILAEMEGVTFYDASMAKYGFGATEVVITH
jgi:hypothetical protein